MKKLKICEYFWVLKQINKTHPYFESFLRYQDESDMKYFIL
jgi:hypothetical protein